MTGAGLHRTRGRDACLKGTGRTDAADPVAPLLRAKDMAEAREIQLSLRNRCSPGRKAKSGAIRHIAGADAAYDGDTLFAAVVVMTFPGLSVIEKNCTVQKAAFPYIPGLFAFREGPVVAAAFRGLGTVADIPIVNAHGFAHPERMGMARHLGIALGIPTIGVAKELLTGRSAEHGPERGSVATVSDRDGVIAMAVRTAAGQKPVYVSAGHMTDLAQAVDVAVTSTLSHRLPEPLRIADQESGMCRSYFMKKNRGDTLIFPQEDDMADEEATGQE